MADQPILQIRGLRKSFGPLEVLKGIDLCALHSGLARARGKPDYGNPKLLEDFKRKLLLPRAGAVSEPARARR